MIKRWIITLGVSVLLIAGIVGSADAYTASVSYFFEGIDLDTGEVYLDRTVLVVFQGEPSQDIDEILKPLVDFYLNFADPLVDFYFDFDPLVDFYFYGPSLSPSLVFDNYDVDDDDDPTRIVGMSLLNIPFEDVDYSMMGSLVFDELSTVSIINNPTLALLTADERYFKIGNFEQDDWMERFEVEEVIPEPSTLLLLGLGLLGLVRIGKWRKHIKRRIKGTIKLLLLTVIAGTTGVLLAGGAQPVAAQDNACEIDLQNNTHTCDTVPAISFIYGPTAGTLANEVVMKITLGPNTTGYTKARLDIEYGGVPTDFTVNIGDSHSNNGGGGDGFDQSNDAEMEIRGTTMNVYGNDDAPRTPSGDHIPLVTKANMVAQGTTLSLEVSDNRFVWDNQSGEAGQLDSEYLYALNGQPDSEGPINYDIYAAFNRVINLGTNRPGSGVTQVTITLGYNVCDIVTQIPRTECEALSALYKSTAGHNWNDNSGWLKTNRPCRWGRVTCSSATDGYVVTGLRLDNNNLNGSIPPELGNLANLETLYLQKNQLSGSIPPELGNLTHLIELYLEENQLSGSLPATLINLTQLGWFNFFGTNLCEPQYNDFQDWLNEIDEKGGGGWYGTGLKCISEVCASVTEIPQTECKALVALYTSTAGGDWSNNTDYWGQTSTPCNWYGVTCSGGSVTDLGLAENQLSGNIPAELGNLVNLQHLYLNGNQELSGSLPANLTNLTSLQSFRFSDTNLCIPQDITFQNWLAGIPYEGTGLVCTNYFGYEDWGGTWHDVDQNGDYGWAAVASNVLAWTEWGTSQLDSAEKILGDFRNYWTPGNGLMKYGWQWWFDGSTETPSGGGWTWAAVSGGGGHWLNYNFLDQYEYWGNWEAIQGIEHYLKNGYGVSITAYPDFTDPGHAFTVWGYESHPDGMITSLWMTDSADSEQKLDRFSLGYNPDISLWYINDGDYSGWHIGGVQALNRRNALNESDTFVIAAISAPHGGISPEDNERVPQGQNKTFTVGHPSYSLQELLIDGDDKKAYCVPTGTGTCKYTFENVSKNHTIQAIFLPESEMVTVKASTELCGGDDDKVSCGSILPNGDVKVKKGEDLTFTIIPGPRDPNKPEHPGYRIMDVLVDGKSQGPAITYAFESIVENHEIEARFTEKTNLLAVVTKKCVCVEEFFGYIFEWDADCDDIDYYSFTAKIIVTDQVLEFEEDPIVVPFSKSRPLVLKVIPIRGDLGLLPSLLRWEKIDSTIVEEAISTEEDLILRPVIECPGGAGKCHH